MIDGIEIVDGELQVTSWPSTMEEYMSSIYEPVETQPKLINAHEVYGVDPDRPRLVLGENFP